MGGKRGRVQNGKMGRILGGKRLRAKDGEKGYGYGWIKG